VNINRNKILYFVEIVASYIAIVTFVLVALHGRSLRWKLFIDHYASFSMLCLMLFISFAATCGILLYARRNIVISLLKPNAFRYAILIIAAVAGFYFKFQAVEFIIFMYAVYAILFINQSLDENKLYQSIHKLTDYFIAGIFTIKSRMPALFILLILLSLPLLLIFNKTAVTGDKLMLQHDAFIEMAQRLKIKKVGLASGFNDYDYPVSWRLQRLGVEVRHITSDRDLEWADAVYASAGKPKATKDWPANGAMLINPRLKKIVFTQTFDFNAIKPARPYAEEIRALLPFVLLPGDLIDVEFWPSAPIPKEIMAYFVFPQWQESHIFNTMVVTDGMSAKICGISIRRIEKAALMWRNMGDTAANPATRIILRVWRQPADPAQAEVTH